MREIRISDGLYRVYLATETRWVELEAEGIETLPKERWKNYRCKTAVFVNAIDKNHNSNRNDTTYGDVTWALYKYPQNPIIKYKAKADEKMKFTKENIYKLFIQYRKDGNYTLHDLQDEILKLDDTPEKVVVPEFVADWIELCKEKANLIDCLQGGYRHFNGCEHIGEDEDWLFEGDNQDVVARAWLYGYEVEKEPRYEVLLPCVRWSDEKSELITDYQKLRFDKTSEETRFVHRSYVPSSNDYTCSLSESDIKEIDERYWPFAVKVDAE